MNHDNKGFETIEHVSDIKLKVFGNTLKDLFINAARGMFSFISLNKDYSPDISQDISINLKYEFTAEDLMIAWLEKLLFLHETKNMLFYRFKIFSLYVSEDTIDKKNNTVLKARAYGEYIDLKKHEILIHIKGPTYHGLKIIHDKNINIFKAEIIFDI